MNGPPAPSREEVARLRWRCRRGMRELDVLLLRYLEQEYPAASAAERAAFAQLLELQDPDVFGYLVGRQLPPEGDTRHVVSRIRRNQL